MESGSSEDTREGHSVFNALLTCQTQEDLIQRYDNIATIYDKFLEATGDLGPVRSAAKVSEVEPNRQARILDVGCGTGTVGEELQKAGYKNLVGVDMSVNSIKLAKEKGVYTELINAILGPNTSLSYDDGSFDLAVSTGCFLPMHLNETHVPEIIRLVKKGGYLVMTMRKKVFDEEEGNMKLKSSLEEMVRDRILERISHDYHVLKDKGDTVMGATLCYRVL